MRQKRRRTFSKVISILLALGILLIMTLSNEPKVQAKKDDGQPIVIDKGTEQEYQIPYDGVPVFEPELIGQKPKFDGYVQDLRFRTSFYKEEINTYSSKYADAIPAASVRRVDESKILFAVSSRNDSDVIAGLEPAYYTLNVFLTDNKGRILDSKNLANGMITDPLYEGSSLTYGNHASGNSYFNETSDGRYSYIYTGQTLNDKSSKIRESSFKIIDDKIEEMQWKDVLFEDLNGTPENYINMLGTDIAISYGISKNKKNNRIWIKKESIYESLVDLEFSDMESQLSGGNFWGSWLYSVGKDSTNNGYYGMVLIRDTTNLHLSYFLVYWDEFGNQIERYKMGVTSSNSNDNLLGSTILPNVSNDKIIYIEQRFKDKVELAKIDLQKSKETIETIMTLPSGSSINMDIGDEANKTLIFYGRKAEGNSTLDEYIKDNQFFIGYFDNNFVIQEAQGINVSENLGIAKLISTYDDHFFLTGAGETRDFSNPPKNGWQEHSKGHETAKKNAFFGEVTLRKDYSPVIKFDEENLIIETKDNPNLENQLLTGIQVYDSYDLSEKNISGQKNMEWLQNRINKNPNLLKYDSLENNIIEEAPIDWSALGLDITDYGPQRISYFITDSRKTATTSSRWLNKVDDKTVYTKEYALRVENFDIPIDKVESLTSVVAKNKGKIQLWELFGEHNYIDDGTSEKDTATVDAEQLKAIQNAKTAYGAKKAAAKYADFEDYSEIIKPYPLTISYTYKNEKGEEKILKREVTVFVTNETTKVDKEKNQVIYGFNFRYPLKEAETLSDQKIAKLSHASLWKYNHFWDKDTSSTTLTTNREAVYQEGVNEPKTGLNNARSARKDYELHLMTKEVTNDLIRVWLADDPVYLNVRQIVQTPHEELVIPTNGYLDLEQLSNNQKDIKQEIPIVSLSGTDGSKINYEKVQLPVSFGNYFYSGEVVIPEYYQYVGYQLSETETNDGLVQMGKPIIDYQGSNNEYWLTFIIKPSIAVDKTIGLYGWDYGQKGGYSITK